jgi:CRP/FNR family transcriptional regulator
MQAGIESTAGLRPAISGRNNAPTPSSIIVRSLRETNCANCSLEPACMASSCEANVTRVNDLVERQRPIQRGALLFHEGTPFQSVYVVRSGAIKTSVMLASGLEQVTGFCLPGDIVGLDSIGLLNYSSTATALETTSVCAITFVELSALAAQLPSLQKHLFRLFGAEIRGDQHMMQMRAQRPAEERLAAFLLSLSARFHRNRLSETHIRLPMSRGDLANHLGLALETVSSLLTRLEQGGIIEVEGRELHIRDHARLIAVANPLDS